jgi:hypothetical protein
MLVVLAFAIGIALWTALARLLFSLSGSFAGLAPAASYTVALIVLGISLIVGYWLVAIGWHLAQRAVLESLASSHSLRSPGNQFLLGLFLGRRRRR